MELVCYENGYMIANGERFCTAGFVYPVVGEAIKDNEKYICIVDDRGEYHYFSTDEKSEGYYGKWFL